MFDEDFRLATPEEAEQFEREEAEWEKAHPGSRTREEQLLAQIEPERPPFKISRKERQGWKNQLRQKRR